VGQGAQVREQLTDHQPGLAARGELERRADEEEFAVGRVAQVAAGDLLAVVGLELGLVVEGIDVGEAAGEEDDDEIAGAGRKVSGARRQRAAAVDFRGEGEGGIEAETARRAALQEITSSHGRYPDASMIPAA